MVPSALFGYVLVAASQGLVGINVIVLDPAGKQSAESVVLAEPVAQTGDVSLTASTTRVTNGRAHIRLAPGIWIIRAIVPERWCWPVQVVVESESAQPSDITLDLSPLGWVVGSLTESSVPSELKAYVDRSVTHSSFATSFKGKPIACPVEQRGRWVCQVPAVSNLDLRLEAPGFGPRYLWNLRVARGKTNETGTLPLFRGASVAGWVHSPNGTAAKPATVVELRAPDGGRLSDVRGMQFSARSDTRGFFQIGPSPPGVYRLTATSGDSISKPERLQLFLEKEERLRSPVVLTPPVTLRLAIDPPQSPEGRPWLLQLLRRYGLHSGERVVSGEPASEAGLWSKRLPPGEYQLSVTTRDGSVWYARTLDLQPGSDEEVVTIEVLRLVGSVSMGDKPLAARVRLSEVKSGVHVSLVADASGQLSGHLPSVDLSSAHWVAEIALSSPKVRHTLMRLQPERVSASEIRFVLRLPEGSVYGRVIDEQGVPQPAGVYASRMRDTWDWTPVDGGDSTRIQTQTEDSTGQFTFTGLTAGSYRVFAMGRGEKAAPDFQSDVTILRVDPDEPPEATVIVLKRAGVISGRVLSAAATGVPGASVVVFAPEATDVPVRPQTTDAEGRFLAHVPAGASRVSINVAAIGVGRRTLGRQVPDSGVLDVSLDPVGGVLVLDFGESEEPDYSGTFIYHDGGIDDAMRLAQWSKANGDVTQRGTLRAPLMSPGEYRVCRIATFSDFLPFFAGTLPRHKCRDGYLPRGGELRLPVPSRSARPEQR